MSDDLLKFVLDAKSVGDLDFVVKSLDELNQAMGRVVKVTSTANDAGQLLSVNIHRQTEDYKNLVQVLKAHKDSGVLEHKQTKESLDLLREERNARKQAREIQRQYTADKKAYTEAVKAANAADALALKQQQAMLRFTQQQQAVGLLRARANLLPQTPIQNVGGGGGGGGTPWWMPAGAGAGGAGGANAFLSGSAFGVAGAGASIGTGIGAVGALLVKAANDAIPFHRQIAEIRTISQQAQLSTDDWAEGIFRLSNAFAVTKEEVAEGTYQLLSNQVAKGADTFKVMHSAMSLAMVTQSSTAESVNALSSAMNSYKLSVEDSERISSVFFKAVDLGRFRLSDLANNIGRVTFTGAQLGVGLEESLAALSVMSRRGLSAAESMTLLHNLMVQLIKPSDEMKKTFHEWGVETGQQAIAAFGFTGVLQRISEAAKDNTTTMGKLFPEIRAMRGAFGLTGDGAKEFEADLKKLENSMRDYKFAQDEVFNAPGQQMERWKSQMSNAITGVGSTFLRAMEVMIRGYRNALTEADKDPTLGGVDRKAFLEARGDNGENTWEDLLYWLEEGERRRERLRYERANRDALAAQKRKQQLQAELNAEADAFEDKARLFNEFNATMMAEQAKADAAAEEAMTTRRTDLRSNISSEIQNMSTILREDRADRLEIVREEQNRAREMRREARRHEVEALKEHHREVEEEIKRSREAREREFQQAGRNLSFNRDLFGIKKDALAFQTGGKANFDQEQGLRNEFRQATMQNLFSAARAGDLSAVRGATGDLDKLLVDEIGARKDRPQDKQIVLGLFNERIRLKRFELSLEIDIEKRKQVEREGDRAREREHKAELLAMDRANREEERAERVRELADKKKERQEERDFAKFERSVTNEIRKQEQSLLGLNPSKFGSTAEGLQAFDTRAASIVEKSELLHPASANVIRGTIDSYREVFALELQRYHLERQRTEAIDQFNKLVKDGSEAMRSGGQADLEALEATRVKVQELNRELVFKNALLRGAPPEEAAKLRDALTPPPSVGDPEQQKQINAYVFKGNPRDPQDVAGDELYRAMYGKGGFIPQTRSLRGSTPAQSVAGDQVNIGDINVVVPAASSPQETGKSVGQAVRRELRRGTLRLSER